MGYKTEVEIFREQLQNLFILDRLLRDKFTDIKELVDQMPGIFHVNDKDTLVINHLNAEGEEWGMLSADEINAMGLEYFIQNIHPDTLKYAGPRFLKFYKEATDNQLNAEFQQIKDPRTGKYELFFTVCKPFKQHNLLLTSSNPVKNLGELSERMTRIAGEEYFIRKNFRQFRSLSPRETEVLELIADGFTNKEISHCLFISCETVKQHRKKIKKKTGARNTAELVKFALAFNLTGFD